MHQKSKLVQLCVNLSWRPHIVGVLKWIYHDIPQKLKVITEYSLSRYWIIKPRHLVETFSGI